MKCPNCGDVRAEYKQKAGWKSSPAKKGWVRTDWTMKKCRNCGFEGEVKP